MTTAGSDPRPGLATMRREYTALGLSESDLAPNWLTQFSQWLAEATDAGVPEPNAMVLATADDRGRPSARTVLLKVLDDRGFAFFTNYESRKAAEITVNPHASLLFPWHAIGRQVQVCGRVTRVDRAETEAYFATRPRESQLGAWASPQSQPVRDRDQLDRALAEVTSRFADSTPQAPPYWGGLRVVPRTVEFWQGREGRLHDRLRYRLDTVAGWVIERLAP